MRLSIKVILSLMFGVFSMPGYAQDQNSGFLDDYDELKPVDDVLLDRLYVGPDFRQKVAGTTSFMFDQPEVFIAADSKYKGMKPDDMKILADSLRDVFAGVLVEEYQIAASPGPNTLIMRMALTNVHLKKKSRGLLGYTPVGFVAGSAKRAMSDFVDKILLTEVVWEAEILDSQTGERYGAIVIGMGDRKDKKEFTSWEQLNQAMELGATRVMCRLDNAGAAEGEMRDCLAEITGM